jgi:hypothetical protein
MPTYVINPVWHGGSEPPGPYQVDRRLARKIDPMTRVAVEGAHAALAGLLGSVPPERIGLCFSNRLGGWAFGEPEMARLRQTRDAAGVSPFLGTAWFPAAPQGEVSIALKLRGHAKTFAGHGAAFLHALEYADGLLEDGVADYVLVAAVEAIVSPWLLSRLGVAPRVEAGLVLLQRTRPAGPAACLGGGPAAVTRVVSPTEAPFPVDGTRHFLRLLDECRPGGRPVALCVGDPSRDPVVCLTPPTPEDPSC